MRRKDHEQVVATLRDEVRHLRRENESLQNRLMYVAGATWTPPPPAVDDLDGPEPETFSWAPEQEFDAAAPE